MDRGSGLEVSMREVAQDSLPHPWLLFGPQSPSISLAALTRACPLPPPGASFLAWKVGAGTRRWKRRGGIPLCTGKKSRAPATAGLSFGNRKTQTQTQAAGVGRDPALDRNASTEVGESRTDTSECALRILLSLCR